MEHAMWIPDEHAIKLAVKSVLAIKPLAAQDELVRAVMIGSHTVANPAIVNTIAETVLKEMERRGNRKP